MIKTFGCKETEKIFRGSFSRKMPTDIQRIALRKLTQIHAAETLDFLRVPPANFLETTCRRPGRTMEHPDQRSMADLLRLEGWTRL
jgi:plasmid maintenance system killer protein